MLAHSKMISVIDKVGLETILGTYITENGKIARNMDMVCWPCIMERNM